MARTSWTIARWAETDIRIHVTFLLLPAFLVLPEILSGHISEGLAQLAFMALAFGTIVLHEFGHVLMARRLGARTGDIVLTPIGGAAMIESGFDRPRDEILIALAGPAVNLVIGAMTAGIMWVSGVSFSLDGTAIEAALSAILAINAILFGFNMIPLFPMDGGRVLRALSSMLFGPVTGTRIAVIVGLLVAASVCGFALYTGMYFMAVVVVLMAAVGVIEMRATRAAQPATAGEPVTR